MREDKEVKTRDLDNYCSVYKYLDIEGAKKLLSDKTILFSRPSDFNDPFDSYIDNTVNFDFDEGSFKRLICIIRKSSELGKNFNGVFKKDEKNYYNNLSLDDKKEYMNKWADNIKRGGLEEYRKVLLNFNEKMSEGTREILKSTGVFCASRVFNSLLMWSHYSDNHKGVVIEFYPKTKDSVFKKVRYVNYSLMRPHLYSSIDEYFEKSVYSEKEKTSAEYIDSILYTKFSDWSYEEEIRIARTDVFIGDNIKNAEKAGHNFHEEDLISIYIGAKISEEDQKKIINLAKKNIDSYINIYKMNLDTKEFKLNPKRVE